MEFFNQAIDILKILVMALGAGLAVWGVIKMCIRDSAKGVFVPVSSLPQREPMKGVQTA